MITVLVGTNPYSFNRLVSAIDGLAEQHNWEVFIQLGNTKTTPSHCLFSHFLPKNELMQKISQSEFVICHGGFGSIQDALSLGKKVIAVPRYPQLGESNDYQVELVKELEAENRILAVYDIKDLTETIAAVENFDPKTVSNNRIPEIITEFLSK